MNVEPNHPIGELLEKKLMGIEVVPPKEQRKMVRDAIRAVMKWARDEELKRASDPNEWR